MSTGLDPPSVNSALHLLSCAALAVEEACAPTGMSDSKDDTKESAASYVTDCQLFGRDHKLPESLKIPAEHIPFLQADIITGFAQVFAQWIEFRLVRFCYQPTLPQTTFGDLRTLASMALFRIRLQDWPEPAATERYIRDFIDGHLRQLEAHFAVSTRVSPPTVPSVPDMVSALKAEFGINAEFSSDLVNVAEDDVPATLVPNADVAVRFRYAGKLTLAERTQRRVQQIEFVKKRVRELEEIDANETAAKRMHTEK